jgi:N-acetyl-anhydromuramoyl-L-alanine amidase
MAQSGASNWQDGWYSAASPCASPNFGPRPPDACVDLIVVHSISLPPGEFGGQAVRDFFLNQLDWDAHPYFDTIRGLQVSSHFFIGRSGAIWQFVSVRERAWHAGASHYRGRDNCNDDSVGIELEGIEGGVFTPQQYQSLCDLAQGLKEILPIAHIAGHEHIAPGRKADPGAGFDWKKLQQNLDWPQSFFPPSALA